MRKVTETKWDQKCRAAYTKWQILATEFNPKMLRIGAAGEEKFWDTAIVGIGRQHGGEYVFIYSEPQLVRAYVKHLLQTKAACKDDDVWTRAQEWVSFNITDAYHGPNTPIIMVT